MSLPGVITTDSRSNCKLTYLDNVGQLHLVDLNTLKNFFKNLRIVVSFNTTNIAVVNFFKKNFELYNVAKIPVGYSDGYQYHILVKNVDSTAANKVYLRDMEKEKPVKGLDLVKIEEIMTKTLKAKRRKTDIVKEVLDNLK